MGRIESRRRFGGEWVVVVVVWVVGFRGEFVFRVVRVRVRVGRVELTGAGDGEGDADADGVDWRDLEAERVMRWGVVGVGFIVFVLVLVSDGFLRFAWLSVSSFVVDVDVDIDADLRLRLPVACSESTGALSFGFTFDTWKYWFSLPLNEVVLLTGTSSDCAVASTSLWIVFCGRVIIIQCYSDWIVW